jgi:hypothetical protein
MNYLYMPFLIQGLVMAWDERFHQKRGLGRWERLGHPLDTLSVLIPFIYVSSNPYTEDSLIVFIWLSLFSCIFITKDEFVHSEQCSGFENWLHAVLFVLHPIIFICTGLLWNRDPDNAFLDIQPMLVGLFMTYQLLKWSIPWKKILK